MFNIGDIVVITNTDYYIPFANILIQECGLTKEQLVRFVYDDSTEKINKSTKYKIIGKIQECYAIEEMNLIQRVYLFSKEGLKLSTPTFGIGTRVYLINNIYPLEFRKISWFKDKDIELATRYAFGVSESKSIYKNSAFFVYAEDDEYCAISKRAYDEVYLVSKKDLAREPVNE